MSRKIRTLIVDDERLARRTLEDLLSRDSEIEVCGSCPDGPSAVEGILRERPDLVLLDVQLPGLNGIQVLESVKRKLPEMSLPLVIFVTAYDRYAIRAFEHHALDYLLKPFGDRRFREALARAKLRIQEQGTREFQRQLLGLVRQHMDESASTALPRGSTGSAAAGTANEGTASATTGPPSPGGSVTLQGDRVAIRDRGKVLLFAVDDIIWFEADGQYVIAHTAEGEVMFRESLGNLQKRLEGLRFLRIHRSTVVNATHIGRVESVAAGGYEIHLKSGRRLAISRRRVGYVLRRLGL